MILTVHKKVEADDGHVDNTQMASVWLVCVFGASVHVVHKVSN